MSGNPAQLYGPPVPRQNLTAPFQDGYAIDLSTVDWTAAGDANTGAPPASANNASPGRVPRGLWTNVSGKIQVVPYNAPSNSTGITIYVQAGTAVPWSVRQIVRAGCDAAFQNATSLLTGF